MSNQITVTKTSIPPMEEYINEIAPLWESRWLTNMGVKHQELEKNLKEYLSVKNVTLFANGHLALENIIEAMGLKGEIITTPFTFASTTHAIVRSGCTPVFCDINERDYTIDTQKIEALITKNTVAIMPVHVYGNVCDCKKIEEIAKKYNLKVIYDAAHAFGITVNGKGIGSFGDASMFSFHATKVFNSVEGGAATYNDDSLKDKLNYVKNFGIPGNDRVVFAGGNAKMSEFHAVMGICNLRHIDEYIEGRKTVVERYRGNLKNVPGIKLSALQPNVKSNYAYFPVVFDGAKYTRDEAVERLAKYNISARKYFYPLLNDCECYGFNGDDTPVAKHIAERVLTLPLYPDLATEDIDKICEIIA